MYAVLATVSSGYPPLQGRSSTCYSPVRHFQAYCYALTFNLHVLSTPPAFILSQDQTLHYELPGLQLRCSRTSVFSQTISNRNTLVPIELLGLEFDCLSTLQLLMCSAASSHRRLQRSAFQPRTFTRQSLTRRSAADSPSIPHRFVANSPSLQALSPLTLARASVYSILSLPACQIRFRAFASIFCSPPQT
jgi:hypothetical protein